MSTAAEGEKVRALGSSTHLHYGVGGGPLSAEGEGGL